MIALLQRTTGAAVTIDGVTIGEIAAGLLVFVAVHRDDERTNVARMAERILSYRVFADAAGRMNHSVQDIDGGLLLVPQFTLTADTKKGTRPSFTKGAAPEKASEYFDLLTTQCQAQLSGVETGRFGADMKVTLVNDGPVTFWLEA